MRLVLAVSPLEVLIIRTIGGCRRTERATFFVEVKGYSLEFLVIDSLDCVDEDVTVGANICGAKERFTTESDSRFDGILLSMQLYH